MNKIISTKTMQTVESIAVEFNFNGALYYATVEKTLESFNDCKTITVEGVFDKNERDVKITDELKNFVIKNI